MKQLPAWSGLSIGTGTAAGAAVAGAVLATVPMAVAAGSAALIGGTTLGDRLTSGRRGLTDAEMENARAIFHDSVKLEKVRITRDHTASLGAPKGIRYTIHLKSDWGHFVDNTLELSYRGLIVLIHEIGHVWQFENGGYSYMHKSLWAQYQAYRRTGSRNGAYDWETVDTERTPWEDWNPEQQATVIEDYNRCWLRTQDGTAADSDHALMARAEPYIKMVRNREGAPRFFRRRRRSPAVP